MSGPQIPEPYCANVSPEQNDSLSLKDLLVTVKTQHFPYDRYF